MLDRHLHFTGPRSIDVQARVTEQRAPTDESVRLLKEMEDEARNKMLSSVRLEGNGFTGVAHRYDDPLNDQTVFIVQFDVNGQRQTIEHRAERREGKQEIADALVTKVAERIAATLLSKAFEGVRL